MSPPSECLSLHRCPAHSSSRRSSLVRPLDASSRCPVGDYRGVAGAVVARHHGAPVSTRGHRSAAGGSERAGQDWRVIVRCPSEDPVSGLL